MLKITVPPLPVWDEAKTAKDNFLALTRLMSSWMNDVAIRSNDSFIRDGSERYRTLETTMPAGTTQFVGRTRSDTYNAYHNGSAWRSWDTARASWRVTMGMDSDLLRVERAAATTGNLTWVTYDQVPRPWAALKMGGNQVITSGAAPALVLLNTADGTGYTGMADTANSRFSVPITGPYHIDVGLVWSNVAGGARLARLWVDGVAMSPDRVCQIPGSAASWGFTGISFTQIFTAGNLVSVAAQQDSGSPVSVLSSGSWFNMNFQGVGA